VCVAQCPIAPAALRISPANNSGLRNHEMKTELVIKYVIYDEFKMVLCSF